MSESSKSHEIRLNSTTPPNLKKGAAILVIAAIVVAGGIGIYHHIQVDHEAAELAAEIAAGPRVRVVQLVKSPTEHNISLVGEARPYASVTLYAKVSGYLKDVRVDKGDIVKKGQLLAIIESPEVDKQWQGAQADTKNKKAIAARINTLRERELVSAQEADQADSDYEVSRARLESLALQKQYEMLRAPFSGTVTARFADPGALVQNAMNSQTSALPVVTISQVDHLRIYTYVDQKDAIFIKSGAPVTVTLAERPELELEAKVSRVSGELDQKTKMLLTEVDVDNKDGALVSGSFVHVSMTVHTPSYFQIPAEALVVHDNKHLVAVIDDANKLNYQEVKVASDDGQQVLLLSGVKEGQRVALNVGGTMTDGMLVRPIVADPPAKPPAPNVPEKTASQKPTAQATDGQKPGTPEVADSSGPKPGSPEPDSRPDSRPGSPSGRN